MKEVLIVGMGGFIGSSTRYLFSLHSLKHYPDKFFLGTLAVNLIGCFLIGLLSGFFKPQQSHSFLLITGFCGGFTTFSTFGMDGLKLLKTSQFGLFAVYVSLSLMGGLLLCALGYLIGHRV